MSRIGKKPIVIPQGVEVTIKDREISVKGPKGSLQIKVNSLVKIEKKDDAILVTVNHPEIKIETSLWGLTRTLIQNMIDGVTVGFKKQLEINGIGFKVAMKGNDLELNAGFSHPVIYKPVEGIKISVEKNIITVEGIDRQVVGQTAAEIRSIKKPEPYKGKGIKYIDETVRRKAGKVVKAGG